MKYIFLPIFLFFAAAQCAHAQDAAANDCPVNPDVPVNISPVFEAPTYNFGANISQLQALSRDITHVIPESLTLGLTHYQPVLSVNPVSIARDLPNGTTCVQVQHIDITFGYQNIVVYIASEIPQQSCGFNEVMLHEQKHVMVQKQILDTFIPVLQHDLKQYLAENGTWQNQNYGQAVTWLHDNVVTIAQNTISKIMDENLRLQRNIDTVQEYTRIGDSCGGQLHMIVRNFLQTGQ